MTKKHFMVDIETLSTALNTVVLSIGAVEFHPFSGKILNEFYQELRLQDQNDRKIDQGTVVWWVKQAAEHPERAEIFLGENKTPVRNALLLLEAFLGESQVSNNANKKYIWACDPDFDCTILDNLYKECKLRTPWQYYETRSVRTVRGLAQLHDLIIRVPEDKTHNALEDCKRQVQELISFNQVVDAALMGAV